MVTIDPNKFYLNNVSVDSVPPKPPGRGGDPGHAGYQNLLVQYSHLPGQPCPLSTSYDLAGKVMTVDLKDDPLYWVARIMQGNSSGAGLSDRLFTLPEGIESVRFRYAGRVSNPR